MPVTVWWGRDRFEFELPAPETLLSAVRHSVAVYTQLPYAAFQIVHDGAVMADDNAPISAYHLRPNSSIAIVANADLPAPPKNTEHAQIASIHAELAAARDHLFPAQHAFLRDLSLAPKSALAKEHSRIGELLLQALLRLDAIVPEPDWLIARADRKAAVKELQACLDQLDNEWAAAQ
ncbi:hypothetical protein GALMADRAFT_140708 [Galerina marginata CBS 339.88]|uniref:BAG domain-containing protein n=1 Tax=Galerina marginata (strain CBS 339.88) TaxID=685588 RepID=A0A067T5H1_GALM3|nr:hypothetical protein GALMADRAFT_140708 [Galerina marginata CBS 339.88]